FYSVKVMKSILEEWPVGIRAKFSQTSKLIKEVGLESVGMPHIKAFGQGLFEIRVKAVEGIGRALFCIMKGKVIIILHGFIKKTEQTPQKEIDLAIKRMKEIRDNE
ncbi:MAG TPA: type II toxin-antitoxin system RelE/ParE family toxin, partial [Candidatus Babeliales bacterium]|nr:type II toxin-antitoxin system RelE/ParE family toxin [Candidatus Babeliales bacterium]